MRNPKILVLPGSNRSGSHNARLAGTVAAELARHDCAVTRITLKDYPLPIYDADLERDKGVPENAGRLARLFHEHDGIVLVSPEYNTSLTPLMKNTLDWISVTSSDSRGKLSPYKGKVFALASASPGKYGGIRALNHLRAVLVNMGSLILTEQVAVSNAETAFDENDRLIDKRTQSLLEDMTKALVETCSLLARRRDGE
ncbi:MAG: NAD(P)H-dependent oxidoreductase [Rhizobiaceae bacterium]